PKSVLHNAPIIPIPLWVCNVCQEKKTAPARSARGAVFFSVARGRQFAPARVQSTIALISASGTFGCGGIGTGPQTPEPPFLTLSISFCSAELSPLYLSATSL